MVDTKSCSKPTTCTNYRSALKVDISSLGESYRAQDCSTQTNVYIHYCKASDGTIYVKDQTVYNKTPSDKRDQIEIDSTLNTFEWYRDTTIASSIG